MTFEIEFPYIPEMAYYSMFILFVSLTLANIDEQLTQAKLVGGWQLTTRNRAQSLPDTDIKCMANAS